MKMNTWYKIDENGNKTPVHFKSTAEIVADYIIKGAETLNKKCTKYMNSGKADEHAKMIGRIGGNVTRAAGNALIATAKDGIQLIEAGVIATGGIIAKDKDTIKMGGKIACQVGKRRVKRIANGVTYDVENDSRFCQIDAMRKGNMKKIQPETNTNMVHSIWLLMTESRVTTLHQILKNFLVLCLNFTWGSGSLIAGNAEKKLMRRILQSRHKQQDIQNIM